MTLDGDFRILGCFQLCIKSAKIRYRWKKYKNMTNVLCKKVVPLKLRGSTYNSCVKRAVRCGAKSWVLKKTDEKKLKTTHSRVLRMICGKILREYVSNETICEMTVVEKIEEFSREQRLRCFQHIVKMDDESAPVKTNSKRGILKKRWKEAVEKDMLAISGLKKGDAQDHAMWRLDCKNLPT